MTVTLCGSHFADCVASLVFLLAMMMVILMPFKNQNKPVLLRLTSPPVADKRTVLRYGNCFTSIFRCACARVPPRARVHCSVSSHIYIIIFTAHLAQLRPPKWSFLTFIWSWTLLEAVRDDGCGWGGVFASQVRCKMEARRRRRWKMPWPPPHNTTLTLLSNLKKRSTTYT